MWIESERPLRYRWPNGEIRLLPNQPVHLDRERALRLLAKAGGKVHVVGPPAQEGACPACHRARYWLSIHDALICEVCHPPAHPSVVRERLELSGPTAAEKAEE